MDLTTIGARAVVGDVALQWGSRSHPGNARPLNEDAVLAVPGIFLVADGMGGHSGGEIASAVAVDVFATAARETGDAGLLVESIDALVAAANDAIRAGGGGMGTTLVGLVVARNGDGHAPVVVNIGDSRCYLFAGGTLRRVTHDHSHVQELIDAGDLTEEAARRHPQRNVITRALGTDDAVAADYVILDERQARILLCSDGLSGELSDEQIASELARGDQAQAVADRLVDAVLDGRAADNVSAVVVDLLWRTVTSGDDDTQPRPDADDTGPRVIAAELQLLPPMGPAHTRIPEPPDETGPRT